MKTIVIMRHGKAADGMHYSDDFERPLEQRGKIEVFESAKILKQNGINPDIIISSPACRTAMTARIVAEVFNIDAGEIIYHAPLYMQHMHDYISALNLFPTKSILIVGHNPFLGELAVHFSKYKIAGFPTSSVVVFKFDSQFIELKSEAVLQFSYLRK